MGLTGGARRCALMLGLLLTACAPGGELSPRHAPSGQPAPLPQADFEAYIAAAHAHVASAGAAAGAPLDPAVVLDRTPFELAPAGRRCTRAEPRRGALLIHGLADSPYHMRDLGEALAERCFLVRAILLPGHGTVPGDLLEVQLEDWTQASAQGVASFAGSVDQLWLAGSGTGASLALHHALFGPMPAGLALGGLVLVAPPIGAVADFAPGGGQRAAYADLLPQGRWLTLLADQDPVRYDSLPENARRQADRLVEALDRQEQALALPVFMVLSAEDATVDAAAARRWFCRDLLGPRRLLWYSRDGASITDCRFVTARASGTGETILDYAHPGLAVAPDDPRYGAAGSLLSCNHYYWETESPAWLLCADPSETSATAPLRYGEVTPENLERWIVRRLTWNPDFAQMIADLAAFIDELE